MKSYPVLVIGAGAWGTALALLLCRNGHRVTLTGRSPEVLEELRRARCNTRRLPGVQLPRTLEILPMRALDAAERIIVLAVPCQALRATLQEHHALASGARALCLTCKGIEEKSLKFPHEIARHCAPETPAALLSGPTFASETARELPTAATVASDEDACRSVVCELFHNTHFRVYPTQDLMGVALGGAMKNVIAIAAGASDGLGFGHNARAALISRGLAEIMRLGEVLGAARETLAGLAGLGDLVLTCTGSESRNYSFGRRLGEGLTPAEASARIGATIEGLYTATACATLALDRQVDMPITSAVTRLLTGKIAPREVVHSLLTRKPKREFY